MNMTKHEGQLTMLATELLHALNIKRDYVAKFETVYGILKAKVKATKHE